jgi:hypothetical protein
MAQPVLVDAKVEAKAKADRPAPQDLAECLPHCDAKNGTL